MSEPSSNWLDGQTGADEIDNPSNPGNDANFDAGDLHVENEAEADARADYDSQVGSDDHQQTVSDARSESGLDGDDQ